MIINNLKNYKITLFTSVFFTFSGYYVILLLCTNLLGKQYSQLFTIPLRLIIIILLFICLKIIGKRASLNEPVLVSFLLFSFLYIARIITEILKDSNYSISNETFLLYYIGFNFLPFILISLKKEHELDQNLYKSAILSSGLLLAVFSLIFYRDLIGTVGRISSAMYEHDNIISPLALSYSGAMTMGVAFSLLLSGNLTKKNKIIMIGIAFLGCIPFFLGASRGSIFALIFPFLLFIYKQTDKRKSFKVAVALILASVALVLLSEFFGSSVISRFSNIGKDVSSGSTSAVRADFWKVAFDHFTNHPIFGYSLEVPEYGQYPHNIFIEVLLTTGIIGFFPFIYLLIQGFKKSMYIFKTRPEATWIVVIFMQSLIQNLFSGSIYGGTSWLWFSLAFILSISFKENYLKSPLEKSSILQKASY